MAKNTTATAKSETAAETTTEAGTTVAAAPSKAAPSQKDVDSLLETLMNPDVSEAAVAKLDERIQKAREELGRMEAARARLSGTGGEEEAPAPRARAPRKQAQVQNGNGNGGARPDHNTHILKAIGSGDLQKSEIKAKLDAMGHEISSASLSTYLQNLTKSKTLIQTKLGNGDARRASYKRNPKSK